MSESERFQHLEDVAEELEFVKSLGGDSIMDVGCGPGWFLEEIPWTVRHGVEICGFDATPPGIVMHEAIPFSRMACRFDVIRCHHVIEHVHDPVAGLEHMRLVLKPGGWLLMSTPDFGGPCAAMYGDQYRMLHDSTHCSLFTNESMHRFLRDHGFSIERVTYPFPRRYRERLSEWGCEGISPPFPGNHMTFYARKTT